MQILIIKPTQAAKSKALTGVRWAGLFLVGVIALGCSESQPTQAPTPVEVGIVTLKQQPVTLKSELPGRTVATLVSEVRPQVGGIVKARRFEEGALVKAGQVLYEIDPALHEAAVAEASATLRTARSQVQSADAKMRRFAELVEIDGVSQQEADDASAAAEQARAGVEQQQAALATARLNLAYTQVRAPIAGRIGKSSITPGALVTASQADALATIRKLDPIYVDVTQSNADVLRLRKSLASGALQSGDAQVQLTLEDGTAYPHPGRLKFSEVSVDEATGTVTLRAQFPNPDELLLPGMYVRATLTEGVERAAILAPQQGIMRDPKGGATALVVDAQGKVAQRTVTTRQSVGDKWLIASGLQEGDRLIVQGTNKVKPGDQVSPVQAELKAASPTTPSGGATGGESPAPAAAGG